MLLIDIIECPLLVDGRLACEDRARRTGPGYRTLLTAWGQASWSADKYWDHQHWATFNSQCATKKDFLRYLPNR